MSRPRLFAELPAGLASVSLRLHGGPNCRPPISRMGNKAGYAEVILAALGLRSGQGAGRYLWAEADPDVAALLRCYPDADMLRRVAEIIRGWKDEEPRALWERLRAERRARAAPCRNCWDGVGKVNPIDCLCFSRRPREEAEGTAEWMWTLGNSWKGEGQHWKEPADPAWSACLTTGEASDRCYRLAEYAAIVSSNRLINMAGPALMNTGNGGTRYGGEFATPVGDVAAAFERVAGEVAGWTAEVTRTLANGKGGGWPLVLVLPTIPEAADVAAWMGTPGDLGDCVVYMDPPYARTTGYAATLGRDEVVRHARAYAELGATVAISEAEIVIPEWRAVEITAGRKGQKRTFSKQQAEWVTMNREPAHRVATQPALFAVGA